MLELLDTGRLAYRLGKGRGIIYLAWAFVPFALGNFMSKIFTLIPGHPSPPDSWPWFEMGLHCLALLLWCYGIFRLYRDHFHLDHEVDADHYRREGW